MQLRWSPAAAEDLFRIIEYIRQENASAAQRIAKTIFVSTGASPVKTESRNQKIEASLGPRNFQLFADGPHRPLFDFAMARDAGDLVQCRVEPNAMGSTLAIQNATMEPQMAFQFREFHASAISKTSRTACGDRPFSASSRWHCSASLSASARLALASSMVSPCEIAAGISSTKQV